MKQKRTIKNMFLGLVALGLVGCANGTPGLGTGVVQNGTYAGEPTGWCMVEGNNVQVVIENGEEVGRRTTLYYTRGHCGTRALTNYTCYTTVINAGPRTYSDGVYKGNNARGISYRRIDCGNRF